MQKISHSRGVVPFRLLFAIIIGFSFIWFGESSASTAQTHDPTAQDSIEQAWEKIEEVDSYSFRTRLVQLVYPAPSIANAGRPPAESTLGISGTYEANQHRMETTIWSDGTFDPNSGIDMLIENGRSYVRQPHQTEWEEINDFSDSFAPGGDPVSFLAGMSNVQQTGVDERTLGGATFSFTTFSFDLNGPAMADYVNKISTQMFRQNGELPQGMTSAAGEGYREMGGQGRVWVGDDGYLARIELDLTLPAGESGEWAEAQLTSDFYDYTLPESSLLPNLLDDPATWLNNTVTTAVQPETTANIGWLILGLASLALLILFVWHTAHTKAFHATLASLIIAAMILPPLLNAQEAHGYYEGQLARSEQQTDREQSAEQYEAIRAEMHTNDWDPQTPASLAEPVMLDIAESPAAVPEFSTANSLGDSSLDSDNDGVNDADEALWDSCPYPNPSTNYDNEEDCSNVTDPSDSDGDTLTDYAEIYELGTLPDMADSDGDDIPDYLEVQGFIYNGTLWYLDPLESDTNNDGQFDSVECPLWNSTSDDFDESAICLDTDNDGTPDLFDTDDDGDGVWDIDDSAPTIAGEIYDDANPLELSIDGLETDKPVLVELEFRPTDPDLLTYSGLVLDWPGGDYEGQITRGLDTTFESTSNADAQSSDSTAAYGDIKITPVLEVLIPYSDGHYGNLPVNGTYASIDRTIGITVDQWIDDTELASYAISVTDVDETSGDLTAYVPLTTQHSQAGDSPIAFNATMVYQPSQGTGGIADWGAAHQYRLAWMVQMITDSCVADVDEDGDGDPDNEEYGDCTRQDDFSVIHIYQDEPWQLTGLSISEEHGFDVAQLYENPAADPDLNVEDQLWLYAWNMSSTFVEGLDCNSTTTNGDGTVDCVGDGTRDVTLADLPTKIDEWGDGNNYVALDGIDSYPHDGYLGYVATTETPALLDSVFSTYTASQQYTSILMAYENTNRSVDITTATDDGGGGLLFDFTDEATSVIAGMTFNTFSYDEDTAAWEEADTEAHLEFLTEYLETNDSFFFPEDDSDEAAEEVEGKLLWFQSYHLTLAAGLVGLVEYDGAPLLLPSFGSEAESADYLRDIEGLYDTAATSAASRLGTLLAYYIADLVLKTDRTTLTWSYMRFIYTADDLSSTAKGRFVASIKSIKGYKEFKLFGNKKLTQLTIKDASLKMVKTSLKVFLLGAAIVATGAILNLLGLNDIGNVIVAIGLVFVAIASIALTTLETIGLLGKVKLISTLSSTLDGKTKAYAKVTSFNKSYKKTYRVQAKYGLAVGIGIALVSFGFALSALGGSPAGYEVAAAAAYFIASIIVELIFFVISLFVPVGTLIVLFIELVDIILLVLSYIFDDVPKSISGAITEAIANSLYDFDMFASNMEDENRLQLGFDSNLVDPELGYVWSNSLIFSTTVTNTLWTESFSREQLEKNSFAYAVSEDPTELDGVTLSNSYNSDDWESLDYDDYLLTNPDAEDYGDKGIRLQKTVSTTLLFSDVGTGINIDLADTYFLEKYRLKGEGCWTLTYFFTQFEVSCEEYAFKDAAETELPNFTFDILPDSLAEFVRLSWNANMPDQYDQDGDGVINQAHNGADPNDQDADSDDDGIHDYYEIVDGLDPEAADGDGDGLTDWEEIYLYDTDPTLTDSDNDGLTDYAEAKAGWIIAYTASDGSTQTTRIWSDPNIDDTDDDGLGDLQEMIYGFNPNAANDSSAIDNLIEIEDILLEEVEGPQLLLKFEEGEDDTVVTDHSGYGHNFICDSTTTCPETAVDGIYGNAFSFDGSNNYLETDFTLDPADTAFTAALWFNPEAFDTGTFQKLITQEADNGSDATWLGFLGDGGFYSFVNGTVIEADLNAPTNEWSHGAVTYDGTTLSIYFNGELKKSTPVTAAASTQPMRISVDGNSNSDYFKGDIDEVAIFDRVLTEDEISDLMNGRYNTNDLIVRPGAELSYQATVTNTAPTRDANGFLYANSNIASPEVAEPVLATGFEIDQRLAYFQSVIETHPSTPNVADGGTLYCIDDGTCPTAGATGAFNNSLDFDGVDDVIYVPKLSSDITELHDDENQIFFWMYVDAYPTSGNAMILDTDDSSAGAMDIYIDSSGYLHFDSVGYGDGTSLNLIPLQTWTHIGYRDGENLTINGGDEAIVATNSDDSARHPVFGPGRLGNSLDGNEPFNGRIDELVIVLGGVGDSLVSSNIYLGDYYDLGAGFRADALFDLDELITDDTNSNVGYLNIVNDLRELDCTSSAIGCPVVTNSGQYGDGLTLDGSNDGLDIDSIAFAKSDYTLGMWFKTNGSAEQTLLSADDGNGLALQLYLNASGQPRFIHRFPGGASGGSELSTATAANDDGWHYLTAVKEEETLYLYIDGELVDSVSGITAVATDNVALALGYDVANSNSFFNGEMDELIIIDEAVDADGVSYLMNSRYPAIEIPTVFEAFELDAQTAAIPSGTATVAENIESGSVHQFEQEVEVAFDLTESINVTTFNHEESDNEDDGSDLTGFFRFEETPGSTTFENQVQVETNGSGSVNNFLALNATCSGTGCPIAGVNGVDGRALYFDGSDDYLHVNIVGDVNEQNDGTFDDLPSSHVPDAQSISVWVNGSEGTIFNRGQSANSFHFQVDFGRVSFIDGDSYKSFEFDMPVNRWTHLVAAISDDGIISVYVDSELVGTLNSGSTSADIVNGDWHIGSNHGTQNHFKGYMDDLRIYEVEVDLAAAQALYENTAPRIRFEFDEASDETNFVDSISGYVAEPATVECVDLTLESLTVQSLDAELTNLVIEVGDEMVYYGSVSDFGAVITDTTPVSQTLNVTTPICATSQTISASAVYSDGSEITFSGSASATIAEVASADVAFTESGQQMTLSFASAAPYNANSPIAGTDGRIGNVLFFPGSDEGYLEMLDSEGLGEFATSDFTIMGWISTDQNGIPIWAKDDGDGLAESGEKALALDADGQLTFTSFGASSDVYIYTTEAVNDNVWHHFAVTWDYDGSGTGGSYAIYVDGVDVTDGGSSSYTAANPDNGGDSWKIGRSDLDSGAYGYFDGELDELTFYTGRALESGLVYETYLREARWYRDTAQFSVLVDDDAPTLTLQTKYRFFPGSYIQLVATPDDPTSAIELVQFGAKGPSDSDYVWDTAELCSDSGVAYCPNFSVSGDGQYDVIFRIVDSVGNETTSEVYEFYVDKTGPNVSGNGPIVSNKIGNSLSLFIANSDMSVAATQISDATWQLSFSGTISDPDLASNVSGSGVNDNALYITVLNSALDVVGAPNQPATVNQDGSWTINYEVTGIAPVGRYYVNASAEDEVENKSETSLGTFSIDMQSPFVGMAHRLWPNQIISATHVISGVVTDQPDWAGAEIALHFEEGNDANAYYNYGNEQQLLECSSNCPANTVSGAFGRGLDFADGSQNWALDNTVISDSVNFDSNDDFTIAFWVQPAATQLNTGQETNSLIEKWGDGTSYPYSISLYNSTSADAGKIIASRSDGTNTPVLTSTTTLVNDFYHVALVKDGDLLTLYVDGVAEMTVTDTTMGETTNSDSLALGHRPDSTDYTFTGILDELFIYDRARTGSDVYAMAQNEVNGGNQVELAFEAIDFANYPDVLSINDRQADVTWQSATVDLPTSLGSSWSYTLSDMENWYYIHLRGQDSGGNESDAETVWHGLIDHVDPTIIASGTQFGAGDLGKTSYAFAMSDFLLDLDTAVYPCSSPITTTMTYDNSDAPFDGLAYQLTGSCTADELQASGTFSVCDIAGHCVSKIITPTVTTDMQYSLSAVTTSISEGASGVTATLGYTITRAGDLDRSSSVDFDFSASSADYENSQVSGTGVSESSGTVTFASGAETANITVDANGNNVDNVDKEIVLTLSSPTGADGSGVGVLTNSPITTTIVDDDTRGVSIVGADSGLAVTEGGITDTYTIALASEPTAAVTITLGLDNNQVDLGAGAGNPISLTYTTLDWMTPQTVTVTAIDDNFVEITGTTTISHTVVGGDYGVIQPSNISITVTDNDTAGVQIAPETLIITETGITSADFVMTLLSEPLSPVTVTLSTDDSTECTVSPTELTLTSLDWNTGITATVTSVDEASDDGDQLCTIVTSTADSEDADYDGLVVSDVSTVVIDDDGTPSINFSAITITTTEDAGNLVISLGLSNPSDSTVEVTVTSGDNGATADVDYTAVSETVTFAPLETSATVTVTILEDSIDEPAESLTLTLSSPVAADLGLVNMIGIEIEDNDLPPAISLNSDLASGSELDGTLSMTVSLSHASASTVTVMLESTDLTATAADLTSARADYTAIGQTVVFAPGELAQTVDISILDDGVYEESETFIVTLSNPVSGTLDTPATATITILDDELPPMINFSSGTASVGESDGTLPVTITLSHMAANTVTVMLQSADLTATARTDYTAISQAVRFAPGELSQTVDVVILSDDEDELDENFSLLLSNPANGDLGTMAEVVVTIINDNDDDELPKATVIYLPLISRSKPLGPDLVVDSIDLVAGTVEITIKNVGNAPANNPFWVDLFVNPAVLPTKANDTLDVLNQPGFVWGINPALMPLAPDGVIKLTINDSSFAAEVSTFSGTIVAGDSLVAHVDSANSLTTYGAVNESHEMNSGVYNNVTSVSASADVDMSDLSAEHGFRLAHLAVVLQKF